MFVALGGVTSAKSADSQTNGVRRCCENPWMLMVTPYAAWVYEQNCVTLLSMRQPMILTLFQNTVFPFRWCVDALRSRQRTRRLLDFKASQIRCPTMGQYLSVARYWCLLWSGCALGAVTPWERKMFFCSSTHAADRESSDAERAPDNPPLSDLFCRRGRLMRTGWCIRAFCDCAESWGQPLS